MEDADKKALAEARRGAAAGARRAAGAGEGGTAAPRVAGGMGLLDGPKAKHVNAKVSPKLFQAAAEKVGTTPPAAVIEAALASLATEADVDPESLDRMEF